MIREIRWTKTARQTYLDLLLYLQDKWGDESALKFDQKVQKRISAIRHTPLMFPASSHFREKNIRRCVVSKQSSFYYRVGDTFVDILAFFDNRSKQEDLEFD